MWMFSHSAAEDRVYALVFDVRDVSVIDSNKSICGFMKPVFPLSLDMTEGNVDLESNDIKNNWISTCC